MIKLRPVLEIYITNVCNLECRGCNRFNNYNFKGHLYWDDYADDFERWSTRIDADTITVIGGEPALNPDLEKWIMNLRRLWPTTQIMIQTNGTYIRPNFKDFWKKYEAGFAVSLHDPKISEEIMARWKHEFGEYYDNFLQGFIFQGTTIVKNQNHFVLHDSERELAFKYCSVKTDHTVFRGKLYKCPTMALISEFSHQFDLRLTEKQRELIDSYTPLESTCSDDELNKFVSDRDKSINQCEICPSKIDWLSAYGPEKYTLPIPYRSGDKLPNYDPINEKNLEFYKKHLT